VFVVLQDDCTVRKFGPSGGQEMVIGESSIGSDSGIDLTIPTLRDRTASITHGGPPFNNPTAITIAPSGDLYVSDGYGNARIHRFDADGHLTDSWGEPGTGPREFHIPHCVYASSDGRIFVADRENDRIQIFSPNGRYLDQWTDIHRPTSITEDGNGRFFVTEFPRPQGWPSFVHGPVTHETEGRVSIFDGDGALLDRFGGRSEAAFGFLAPHGVAVNSAGRIYIAEVVGSYLRGRRQFEDFRYTNDECHLLHVLDPLDRADDRPNESDKGFRMR
jgi:DNA-binding beta-propeller fold protein YncE